MMNLHFLGHFAIKEFYQKNLHLEQTQKTMSEGVILLDFLCDLKNGLRFGSFP